MSVLTNILINLYGEDFREDFEDHLALLKEINIYYRRKRTKIDEVSKVEFLYLADRLRCNYSDISIYLNDDCYWSYSQWFKETFIEDYDKALTEVEQQQTIPSDRELCILRLAREAAYKNIAYKTMFKFCREYLANAEEYTLFWVEYHNTNINILITKTI